MHSILNGDIQFADIFLYDIKERVNSQTLSKFKVLKSFTNEWISVHDWKEERFEESYLSYNFVYDIKVSEID